MESPIKNQINTIFVHVSDLEKSVRWYSQLLGQDYDLNNVFKPVYNIHINHHTGLTLDAGPEEVIKKQSPHDDPKFNFHTDDIKMAHEYVTQLGYTIKSEIAQFDDFSFFTVSDPDGNIVMICTG